MSDSRPGADASPAAKPLRVLIVDDHLSNRIVAETLLEKAGYQPIPAETGEAALDLLRQEWVDVALVDLHMPGLSGLEVARWIRLEEASRGRAPMPVLLLTADVSPKARREALDCGVSEVLSKPMSIAELVRHIGDFDAQPHAPEPPALPQADSFVGTFLQDLRDSMENDAAFASYLDNAIRDAHASLRSLDNALRAHDGRAAANAAHALKGVCSNLGMDGLASVCAQLEEDCAGEQSPPSARFDALTRLEEGLQAGLLQIDARFRHR